MGEIQRFMSTQVNRIVSCSDISKIFKLHLTYFISSRSEICSSLKYESNLWIDLVISSSCHPEKQGKFPTKEFSPCVN